VCLEWIPDRKAIKVVEMGDEFGTAAPPPNPEGKILHALTADQLLRLQKAFSLFDVDGNNGIDQFEAREMMRALEGVVVGEGEQVELEAVIEHVWRTLSRTAAQPLDFEEVKRVILGLVYARIQANRFYVVVSLHEAESIRGWIHMQRNLRAMVIPNADTTLGLRVGSYLLDGSHKYVPAYNYQQDSTEACLRFADSDVYYSERRLHLLLRAMQLNTLDARREWFDDVRACKRRQQTPWEKTSVARVLTMHDEFELIEHKALVSRVRTLIRLRGMLMLDAFRAFDQDRDGN
jgi:hypothetical protein